MIEIKNLTKKYNEQTVLEDMNFKFPNKGLICLLGASGCGKSTLLNILAGFDSDYTGEVTVLGSSISKMNDDELCSYRRDNIGFVFQSYNLLLKYTALENIELACEAQNISQSEGAIKAKELFSKLNISDKENEKAENFSGGQKQRVCIARALIGNPKIILADEPTGALDRKNSTEIMELLKEISKERLVIVITHDQKICDFADEVLSIKDKKLIGNTSLSTDLLGVKLCRKPDFKLSAFSRAYKNFKVNLSRYTAISLAISIGVLAFMLSLSSVNVIEKSITNFKEKNTAFNNGYIKGEDDGSIINFLQLDNRLENVYYQYKITDIILTVDEQQENIKEKYPTSKSTENMSYGVMPKINKNQIALNTSLAKKLSSDINKLIGKQLVLTYDKTDYKLTISGIFNATFDDFVVSSDIERDFYKNFADEKNYSIHYDVKDFDDIVSVSEMLADKKIYSKNASNEVKALKDTFTNLSRLFIVVSILILAIGLFISVVLLAKHQNSRYKEIGLLSALGVSKRSIGLIIKYENFLLSVQSVMMNVIFVGVTVIIACAMKYELIIKISQILVSALFTGVVVVLISVLSSYKIIHTEPAVALRK